MTWRRERVEYAGKAVQIPLPEGQGTGLGKPLKPTVNHNLPEVRHLARNDARARSVLRAAWEAGAKVAIPVVALAETVRGRPDDAPVNRIVKAIGDFIDVTQQDGRSAGHLLGDTGMSSTIDAIVIACTDRTGDGAILTGDPGDLRRLAEHNSSIDIVPL